MPNKKIIAIVGATGAQGGGLARTISPTRTASSRHHARRELRKATLAAAGAEVVAADVDDLASLTKAFTGAYGAFCLTFFWAHYSPDREKASAENMAKAAKASNLQHVVWSTL